MGISRQILDNFLLAPKDVPVSLLIRHSARYPILDPSEVYTVGLTPEGVEMAEELGQQLSKFFSPGRLMSTPVQRCMDTASGIARGAGWQERVITDARLSFPFIEPAYYRLESYNTGTQFPFEVSVLSHLLLEDGHPKPSMDIHVTHDSVITCLLGYWLGYKFDQTNWPGFLEGLLIWQRNGKVYTAWRSEVREISDLLMTGLKSLEVQ